MRLNAQTDYSLRLLMFLAAKDGAAATIGEASARLNLSQTHMMRIAAKLAAAGFVRSTRGRAGGISLAKEPSNIIVEQVIKAIEPDFALVECFGGGGCSIEPGCLLKQALAEALECFFGRLRTVSLDQLTSSNRAELKSIFRLR